MVFSKLLQKVHRRLFRRAPLFSTDDVQLGRDVSIGDNVVFDCQRVRIGDGVVIGDNVKFKCTVLEIGDFVTIYDYCFFPGPGELFIGHNSWVGISSVVDSMGGTRIGNNVCIGVHSQLWSHMKFGDVMAGCRFHSTKPLVIGDDAWLGAHCLVSPVSIGERSLAMLGSLITKDMEADRCYAGVPALDITDRIGPQFAPTPVSERLAYMEQRFDEFFAGRPVGLREQFCAVESLAGLTLDAGLTYFDVGARCYTKRGTSLERALVRFMLPDAKFVPLAGH